MAHRFSVKRIADALRLGATYKLASGSSMLI